MSLVLYGRPDCHLCDDVRAVLRRIGVDFTEIDINSDDALFKRYLERIPVIELDGEELYDFFVDEADLLARLRRVRDRA
ncbi:MAG TPA: glutaredoxin family protein [Solirubrobacteraceae bacterium]